MVAGQERFVVEGIDVRGRALHREEDDAFRPGREMRLARGERTGGLLRRHCAESRKGEVAESARKSLEGLTTRHPREDCGFGMAEGIGVHDRRGAGSFNHEWNESDELEK